MSVFTNALRIAPFILCLATWFAHAAGASSVFAADPKVRAAIDEAVEKERTRFGGRTPVPGVLIGVWDGAGGSYVHAFGEADLATHRALTASDHFRIGSNTKTFVISVLLQLIDEGKLSLDDKLSRFPLGVTIPNADNITVRELCEMRSGLFEAYDVPGLQRLASVAGMTFDARTLVANAVKQKPLFRPGARYNYSNTNYLILGLIIESVSGDPVGDEIRRRLLDPFKLSETDYPATEAMPAPWAHGYELTKGGGWNDVSGTIPVSLMGAAGEMISTPADMRRWVELYVDGKTNLPATQRERLACIPTGEGTLSFGLGIGCSAGWFGYTGGLPGYNTSGYYLPAEHVTIIAWVTLQSGKYWPGVANAIFKDVAAVVTPDHIPFGQPPAKTHGARQR